MFFSFNSKAFLLLAIAFGVIALVGAAEWHFPNNHEGYAPEQPIEYSHRLHAGELQIDCLYCHYGARTSRHASIPPADLCLNCHQTVTASFDATREEREAAASEERDEKLIVSDELKKLYDALGLEPDETGNMVQVRDPRPVEWVRVHNLPDFVYFDHSVHVARDLACEECHGPVVAMERMRQEKDLSMGWCVECHRTKPADPSDALADFDGMERERKHVSTDCAVCHY